MANTFRILHLTDLHLTSGGFPGLDGKVDLPSVQSDYGRIGAFTDTMTSLASYLRSRKEGLDAIVISGDVLSMGDPAGFQCLEGVLDGLGDLRPPNSRIVVTPGNHDVVWGEQPSSKSRYRHFLAAFQKAGFVIPYLDGCIEREPDTKRDILLDKEMRVAILPLNTSNWCGTTVQLKSGEESTLDIARVSGPHLEFTRKLLDKARSKVGGRRITLIAAAHHHLLPVSRDEEIKPFENITNLERVRAFLAEEEVDLYLHGHKHFRRSFWDHPYTSDGEVRTLLIASGSTLTGEDENYGTAQLFELDSGLPPRHLTAYSIPMRKHGERINSLKPDESKVLGLPVENWSTGSPKQIMADDLDEAYSQILALFRSASDHAETILNLTVHIRSPETEVTLPAAYPADVPGASGDPDKWLMDIAKWWQHSELYPSDHTHFNHGSRLTAFSQIDRITEALTHRHKSGRAVAILVDPRLDDVGDVQLRFPSFTAVQVELTQTPAGYSLHGIGYFRKHEMKYWWPVNVAEMTIILCDIRDRLRPSVNAPIVIGSVTTFSATAHLAKQPTLVAVPTLDLWVNDQSRRSMLTELAYVACHPSQDLSVRRRKAAADGWCQIVGGLRPVGGLAGEDLPVSIPGLGFLVHELERFSTLSGNRSGLSLAKQMRRIQTLNLKYLEMSKGRKVQNRQQWQNDIADACTKAERSVDRLVKRLGTS